MHSHVAATRMKTILVGLQITLSDIFTTCPILS